MVTDDVSTAHRGVTPVFPSRIPGVLLPPQRSGSALLGAFGCGAARLHVDLCRLASAMCRRCAPVPR